LTLVHQNNLKTSKNINLKQKISKEFLESKNN